MNCEILPIPIQSTPWRGSPWRIGNFEPYDRDELDSPELGAKPANLAGTCHATS